MATAKRLKVAVHARRPAGNAPGRSLRSTSLPTWSAPETAWRRSANLPTTMRTILIRHARGWNGRSLHFTSSSRDYARVAFLNDAFRDFDQVEGAIARQFDFSELELGAVRF